MTKKTYSEKLLDPRWQRLRLRVFDRDGFRCKECGDDKNTLHVHHKSYHGEPWEAPMSSLSTVCAKCHKKEHSNKEPEFTYEHENHPHSKPYFGDEKHDEHGRLKYHIDNPDYPPLYKNGHNTKPLILTYKELIAWKNDDHQKHIPTTVIFTFKEMVKYSLMLNLDYKETFMYTHSKISFKEWRDYLRQTSEEHCKEYNLVITRGKAIYGAKDVNDLMNSQYAEEF